MKRKRILVVDDEVVVLDVIQAMLTEMGYDVGCATTATAAVAAASAGRFDLIIVDIDMRGTNGLQLTETIIAADPEARVIVNTGYPDDPNARRALEAGAVSILRKPYEIAEIIDVIDKLRRAKGRKSLARSSSVA